MGNASWITLALTLAAGAGLGSLLSAREEPAPVPAATEKAAAEALAASFEILDPEKRDVRLDALGEGTLDLLVKNGAGKRKLAFDVVLAKGTAKVEPPDAELNEASVTLLSLKLTGASDCPCRGAIVVRSIAPLALPLHASVTLTPTPATTDPAALAVWGGGLFALALGLAGLSILSRANALGARAETPQWEPGESWLTNLAVVGAVFNGLFTVTALTEKLGSMSTGELLMTTALFVALAGLAPAVFKLGAASTPKGGGNVRWFLAAAVFTLWACAGQLGLSCALLEDARTAGLLAPIVCWLLQGLIAALVAFVGWYAVCSFKVLDNVKSPDDATEESVAARGAAGATRWRLL